MLDLWLNLFFCLELVKSEIWGSKFTSLSLQLSNQEAHRKVPEKTDLLRFWEACEEQNEILGLNFSKYHHLRPEMELHHDLHLALILPRGK